MEIQQPISTYSNNFTEETQLQAIAHNDKLSPEQKMAEMGRKFESALLKSFLEDALEPVFEGVIDENSSAHGIYRHFLTDALSNSISQAQSFGFTSALQAQVPRAPLAAESSSTPNPLTQK